MNCQQFNQIIVKLACQVMADDAEHTCALVHAETCGQCSARLARQQNIVTGLQALAEQEQTIKAPAYIGLVLQAAFEKPRTASADCTN